MKVRVHLIVFKLLKIHFLWVHGEGWEYKILLLKLNRPIVDEFEVFENELLAVAGVKSVSTSSSVPGYRVMLEGIGELGADDESSSRLIYADETFLETFNIELVDGKNFDGNIKLVTVLYIIVIYKCQYI